jgi:hypothetical protein
MNSSRLTARSVISISDLFALSKRASIGTDSDRRQIFLENARFLAQEIPARIDERIARFGSLPFIVGTHPSIQELTALYQSSKHQLTPFQTRNQKFDWDTAKSFSETLSTLLHNHRNVLDVLSVAVRDCKAASNYMSQEEMTSFIEDTVKGRIGVRSKYIYFWFV